MKTIRLAGCIIQNDSGHILLLHRNTPKRTQWEIPGGKIEEGEDTATTARREVQEELDIDVEILRELDTKSFVEDTYVMQYTWFSAKIVAKTPRIAEPELYDKLQYLSLDDLERLAAKLSPNTANFLVELRAGRVQLEA